MKLGSTNRRIFKILCFFIFFLCSPDLSLKAELNRFYQKSDGLAGTYFSAFLQDSHGYFWTASKTGLSRFDGYNFKAYYYDVQDVSSINSSQIQSLFEDSKGLLWVGTNVGINIYNYESDSFEPIKLLFQGNEINLAVKQILEDSDKNCWLITSNGLVCIEMKTKNQSFYNLRFDHTGFPSYTQFNQAIIDPKGNIWIASTSDGVVIFNTSEKKFQTFSEYTGKKFNFLGRLIFTIHINPAGTILVGAREGDIVVYDYFTKELYTVPFKTRTEGILLGGVSSIITDSNGKTWVGTEYHGLKELDLKNRVLVDANALLDVDNVNKSKILCYEDRWGDLWFGVNYQGLYHKVKRVQAFNSFTPLNCNLGHHLAKSILHDSRGNLWVGTDGGGLNILKKGSSQFQSAEKAINGGSILKKQVIMCLHEDRMGRIWIGTYLEGLYFFDSRNNSINHYPVSDFGDGSHLNAIYNIEEDRKGNLWFGTNGSGLFYMERASGKMTHIGQIEANGKPAFLNRYINDIKIDQSNTLWLATYNGFLAWNPDKKTLMEFKGLINKTNDESIYSMVFDKSGTLWLASLSGLYCFNPENQKLICYNTDTGLCDNSVTAVVLADDGKIWASTSNGISVFDPDKNLFKNYFEYDGLPFNEFLVHSSYKDETGNIYFGGNNGFVSFNPKDIVERKENPRLVFSSLKILNQELKNGRLPNNRKVLEKSINETDSIQLRYSDKSFTFEFAAIDFSAPEKIKYAVMMKGFDKSWIIKDYRQRFATYTNLNPGTYTLQVKSTNSDGIWVEPARSVTIIITPPFWLTWWAFVIYAVFILIITFFVRSTIMFRLRMKHELQQEHFERQKQESINQAKLQFFTNISHEIRTPLTMILAPLQHLIELSVNDDQKLHLGYIKRNTIRLQRLITQLLDFQKIESAGLKNEACLMDMVQFVSDIVHLFEGTAKEQGIEVYLDTSCENLTIWADPDKMDKILFNLLSNALKFTPKGGIITVSVNENLENCEISVSDTGAGIAHEYQEKIFDRFFQVANQTNEKHIGTGIGLHLAKKLTEIQHGTISLKSEPGQGSTFTVCLPLGDKHLSENEKSFSEDNIPIIQDADQLTPEPLVNKISNSHNSSGIHSTILLIEDDPDILNYLEIEFEGKYNILKANNGNEGWELILNHLPTLIISDITMPGMDGILLCKKVKTTLETSHIPVVLLTARTSVEQEIVGLETGADAYIHKPFHPSILRLNVERIIESREVMKQKFSSEMSFVAKEMTVTSADEKFLQKAMDYVKENLSDTELNVEKMCADLGINRVQLYRKLKALTNQVPTEFIRIIRLKQAVYLLEKKKFSVSEVAFHVGFNSLQYFSNSFQKYYKVSPSEYLKRLNIKDE
jgi:signal transduction histidine kinase/ligand-binding sensor domain-containing protein/DNA-binding response OmpR family regulator